MVDFLVSATGLKGQNLFECQFRYFLYAGYIELTTEGVCAFHVSENEKHQKHPENFNLFTLYF